MTPNTKKGFQEDLEQSKFVRIRFRMTDDWIYILDTHKVWRTNSLCAPNSLWSFELAEIIFDQTKEMDFLGVDILDEIPSDLN